MFAKLPEKTMHLLRWSLTIGWLVLIASLFYDPISASLTAPGQWFGPKSADTCFQFQGECLPLTSYPLGARIFWGMVVPSSILILLVFGHEAWRRICPLSFLSQLPRALGWQRRTLIRENSWLGRHHLSLQFSLLFLGLNLRLLLVNSDRLLLGLFLLFTIACAISVGFFYGGKTWCHYFCPMAPVQMIYSEPAGLLGSKAHTAAPMTITQSMCRSVDQQGKEKSACVGCKAACLDIDSENSYLQGINKPDRQLIYYAYLGLVIGFYLYFGLYSGNHHFLSGGVWNETNQLQTLFSPGFYLYGRAIPIPKIFAVPLTLGTFASLTYSFGLWLEKAYKKQNKRLKKPVSLEQIHHHLFTIFSFSAFNLLFFLGVQPTLGWLPSSVQTFLSWAAIVVSSLWLVKTWSRSPQQYAKERDAQLLRNQLHNLPLNLSEWLEGRTLEELNPDEIYTLAKVIPGFTQQYRLEVYTGVLQEFLREKRVTVHASLSVFQKLRQELKISEAEHWEIINQFLEDPSLLSYPGQISETDQTIQRGFNQRPADGESTIYRQR